MTPLRLLLALAPLVMLMGSVGVTAQVPSVWFGTWQVSLERSTYSGPPGYRRATYTIEPSDEGGLRVIYEAVQPRGGVTHLEWTGRLDGREYAVEGIDQVLTYAYTARDDGTYTITARIDGNVAATSEVRFSPDGQTMTSITNARSATGQAIATRTVWERVAE